MPTLTITTKPGKKYRSLRKPRVYEALRKRGYSKQSAARISNAQKSYTLDQLEAFVSSAHYDADTADLIALGIPALKATGVPGELIEPGVRRIRGNLCNVHGRYGPCDKALSGKKPKGGIKKPAKGRAPAKARQTPAQRAQARAQQRQANIDSVAKRMAETDTGLAPTGVRALTAFAQGTQPDPATGKQLAQMGLAEQASDGTYRMTSTGRAMINAMAAGDYQRAVDAVSRGVDAQGKRGERATAAQARQADAAKRQQDAAGKRAAARVGRELARREREAARAKKPAKASVGGGKKPEPDAEKPLKPKPAKRRARSSIPNVGGVGGSAPKPKPKPEKQAVASPALTDAAQRLSDGAELVDADVQALIRNGLARLVKGELVLTELGQRAIRKKDYSSFVVFKDARGQYRWVAQSSTAYQDRDREIVSTKALADDVAYADKLGAYGPLRWWHAPNLNLGVCDFNAMHGRVLIESGTFYSASIAQKIARAAAGLEISLGFLHLPTEPDADGVFHHIRRFERSLVPRGKASNRFTAFAVKETIPMDETKKTYLRTELKFSDEEIADIEARATATEKAADDQQTAFKADEPATAEAVELPDLVINGVTYKAFPPNMDKKVEEADTVIEEDAIGDMPMAEEEVVDENALTLSAGDLAAIQGMIAQVMGALDLEKKVAGHVQGLLAPFQQAQATKDASDAEKAEQIAALQASLKTTQDQLNDLLGLQPAATPRASSAPASILNPFNPADAALLASVKDQVPADQQPYVNEFEDLKMKLFGS
jgi:hypothetical protein